jgi:hypothetical protein
MTPRRSLTCNLEEAPFKGGALPNATYTLRYSARLGIAAGGLNQSTSDRYTLIR